MARKPRGKADRKITNLTQCRVDNLKAFRASKGCTEKYPLVFGVRASENGAVDDSRNKGRPVLRRFLPRMKRKGPLSDKMKRERRSSHIPRKKEDGPTRNERGPRGGG